MCIAVEGWYSMSNYAFCSDRLLWREELRGSLLWNKQWLLWFDFRHQLLQLLQGVEWLLHGLWAPRLHGSADDGSARGLPWQPTTGGLEHEWLHQIMPHYSNGALKLCGHDNVKEHEWMWDILHVLYVKLFHKQYEPTHNTLIWCPVVDQLVYFKNAKGVDSDFYKWK